jgi:single-strand DNA-binding protein
MYNKVFIIGRLTRDPETRYTPSGIAVSRFTVAVSRNFKPQNANGDTADFLRVVAWRRLGEICGEYLKKGRLVEIEGRLQVSSWEKNGEKFKNYEIVADGMQMLERRQDNANTGAAASGSWGAPSEDAALSSGGTEPGAVAVTAEEAAPF